MTEITKAHILPVAAILLAIVASAVAGSAYKQVGQIEMPAMMDMKQCHKDTNCVKWLNDNYVSKATFETYKLEVKAAIAAPHTNYAAVNHNHNYALPSHTHSSSTSSSSGDFDLYTATDSRGDDREDRFDERDTLFILGDNDSNERTVSWEIRDPDNDRIYSRNTGVQPYDDFYLRYEIPNNADRGTYTVLVEIDNEEDEINFFVN